MVLAQGILQVFCSQGLLWVKYLVWKQVIYTLDTICEPVTMILAQAVRQICFHKVP